MVIDILIALNGISTAWGCLVQLASHIQVHPFKRLVGLHINVLIDTAVLGQRCPLPSIRYVFI